MTDGDQLEIGTLLDEEPPPPPTYTEGQVDTISRFLAGFRFPGHKSFDNLPAAKRKTSREAAEAALTRLFDHTD